jgi:hypothetical protein
MLAVLAYTTVTGRDVAAVLAGLAETGGHLRVMMIEEKSQSPLCGQACVREVTAASMLVFCLASHAALLW